jgi:hypothetical protein
LKSAFGHGPVKSYSLLAQSVASDELLYTLPNSTALM